MVLSCAALTAQDVTGIDPQGDTNNDTIIYESDNMESYDPSYHFNESAQNDYNVSPYAPALDSLYWRSQVKNLNFDEDKALPQDSSKNKKDKKGTEQNRSGFLASDLKYLWIALAIAILALIVWKFVPQFKQRNIKNRENLVIGLDELDEDQIRFMDVETPLEQALRNGDYRTAYRLRYLSVIKVLVSKNLILYRKEKTNYEYLLQLSGKDVYEPFRQLTFNFDGIWYGDLAIDKDTYKALDQYFVTFNTLIRN